MLYTFGNRDIGKDFSFIRLSFACLVKHFPSASNKRVEAVAQLLRKWCFKGREGTVPFTTLSFMKPGIGSDDQAGLLGACWHSW